jgi:hypothetical protein
LRVSQGRGPDGRAAPGDPRGRVGARQRVLDHGEWPPHCDLFVLLARPFRKRYPLTAGLAYQVVDDPHYWKAEYRHGGECLACAF